MELSVIGTGYVGLVAGTCFSEIGNKVSCIDIDTKKIESLNEGKIPIFEPGLKELVEKNREKKRLKFSSDYTSVCRSKIVFLAVGTPSQSNGKANLEYLFQAAKDVGENLSDDTIVVIKSTVPVGTHVKVAEVISSVTTKRFAVVNNPEFLREGSAVKDFMEPDRVVVGYKDAFVKDTLRELFSPLVSGAQYLEMSNLSAEMTKYAANCFLATKISFINEVSRLCDLTGADIEEVRDGMATDNRIGGQFLYPGPGYGGSCFPKDVQALVQTGQEHDLPLELIMATESVNEKQKKIMFYKIKDYFKGKLEGKVFTFWGLSFKANTDDVRESSSLVMAELLLSEGAKLKVYDPEGAENFMAVIKELSPELAKGISVCEDKDLALRGSNGLVVMTEWGEFRSPSFVSIKESLETPVIFDARNLFPTEKVLEEGIDYFAIGKKIRGR
ncbi:MAG: UDP-glucose/GDP-mannose dehydrogenase family protein [Bdellovibrionota bacterium]|nr:UDP-glucose/GDP-mannose dehydrogenase family protein [Bdellovibrionota bacterium]